MLLDLFGGSPYFGLVRFEMFFYLAGIKQPMTRQDFASIRLPAPRHSA